MGDAGPLHGLAAREYDSLHHTLRVLAKASFHWHRGRIEIDSLEWRESEGCGVAAL